MLLHCTAVKCSPATASEPRRYDVGRQDTGPKHSEANRRYQQIDDDDQDKDEYGSDTDWQQDDAVMSPPYQAGSAAVTVKSSQIYQRLLLAVAAANVLIHATRFVFPKHTRFITSACQRTSRLRS